MHNWKTSEYTKTIALKEEQLNWIKRNKGKKSGAGFLDDIINNYKKNEHHLQKPNKKTR